MKPQRVAGAEWDPKSSPWRAATTVPGAWGVLDRFRLKKQRMSEMPSVGCGSGRGKQGAYKGFSSAEPSPSAAISWSPVRTSDCPINRFCWTSSQDGAAGLQLLAASDPPSLAWQTAGITGLHTYRAEPASPCR
ncbi:uncharacterized protein LOC134761919 isoform X2 [Pongo abelii]|uniref:uncharacterized protein LOC134761919 isoform X2 n=1 Tax=Pongo abelii TaxID=9601 RepID=UPI003003B270